MRILFAAPFGLETKATIRSRTLPLASGLAALGHDVHVLVPSWDSPGEAPKTQFLGDVCIRQIPPSGGIPGTTMQMWARVLAATPDVLHIVKPRMYAGACQYLAHIWHLVNGQSSGFTTVLDLDDWEQAWSPGSANNIGVQAVLAWQEEWGFRHCHGATAASQWLVRRFRRVNPATPVMYLPNGHSEEHQEQSSRASGNVEVMWFTRFAEIEPNWMFRFWSSLQARIPGANLKIVGTPVEPGLDKPFREALNAFSQSQCSVDWLGYLSKDQVANIAASASCAIAPARISADNLAKCSVRLVDLHRFGVPCVVSSVGEQHRFRALPMVKTVHQGASPEEFAKTVADVCQIPKSTSSDRTTEVVPAWDALSAHLDRFYRMLREKVR